MSEFQAINVEIRGIVPTIMNNGRKANPLDEFARAMKKITAGRPRGGVLSDEQATELQRLDWMGGLYVDDDRRPCWPAENIEAMLLAAAKKTKRGNDSKIGILVDGDSRLMYDGPTDPDKLWLDPRFRKVCMAKPAGKPILRCRPIFHDWYLTAKVLIDPEVIDAETLAVWFEIAGSRIGLSDWRPKFGRFEIVDIQ